MSEAADEPGPWFDQDGYRSTEIYRSLAPETAALVDELHVRGVVMIPNFVDTVVTRAARTDLIDRFEHCGSERLTNVWRRSRPVRDIATAPAAIETLHALYQRRPIPFQTLNFQRGTEQRPHADTIHFDTIPSGFVCAVFVALEDIGAHQGPLTYFPGSQRTEAASPRNRVGKPDEFSYTAYEDEIGQLIEQRQPTLGLLREGDAIIWTAGLLHGGAPIVRADSSRWSQVTHYFFGNCVYITPMESDFERGTLKLRMPLIDIGTGRSVEHRIGEQPARFVHLGRGQSRMLEHGERGVPTHQRITSRARRAARELRAVARRFRR